MTGTNFASLVRRYTGTDSTTFTDANIVLIANTVKDDLAMQIQDLNEDYFGKRTTSNLVATSGTFTNRQYSFPTDMLSRLYRVEAQFDGTNWIKLLNFDLMQMVKPADETNVLANFTNLEGGAYYDINGSTLWIYSAAISAVTNGLAIWYDAWPDDIDTSDLSSGTDLSAINTINMPKQVHELWARKTGMVWKSSYDKPVPLSPFEQRYENDLLTALFSLSNVGADLDIYATLPDDLHLQY